MAFTGILGSADARLANFMLAEIPEAGGLVQSVTQAIILDHTATGTADRVIQINHSLGLSQTAVGNRATILTGSASDSLLLGDSASAIKTVILGVLESLTLLQDVNVTALDKTIAQSLNLTQSVELRGPIYQAIHHNLNLNQDLNGHLSDINLTVEQTLALQQVVGRVYEQTVAQSLALSQVGERKNICIDLMSFTQNVTVGKGGDVSQLLSLVQTAACRSILSLNVTQNLGLYQSVTFFDNRGCIRKQYHPFIGAGTTSVPATAPALTRSTLTLTYPYVSPTTTLVLRNPEFGNKDRLAFSRVNRTTRGGDSIIYSDPKWPKSQLLVFRVLGLKQFQAWDLKQFLSASLGKEIGLLDWEGRQWRGMILNPDSPITHDGTGNFVASIEFQGTIV